MGWATGTARRITRLERQQARRAASIQTDAYSFTISPTCPPSTSIHFRGGLAWWPAYAFYPAGFHIPGYTVDLTDPAKVSVRVNYSSYTYIFTNADWYAPCVVVLSNSGIGAPPEPPDTWPATVPDDALYLLGTLGSPYLEEFETAAEAEDACREIIGDRASLYGIAMGGLILRNDGNTADPNRWMQIDKINRGRSYLFGGKRYGWELG